MYNLECDGIGQKTAEAIIKERSLTKANKILDNVGKLGIKLLTLDDALYPVDAKSIEKMPTFMELEEKVIVQGSKCLAS